jgi:hypothetical protein
MQNIKLKAQKHYDRELSTISKKQNSQNEKQNSQNEKRKNTGRSGRGEQRHCSRDLGHVIVTGSAAQAAQEVLYPVVARRFARDVASKSSPINP